MIFSATCIQGLRGGMDEDRDNGRQRGKGAEIIDETMIEQITRVLG